jgi:hypothetical protein
MGRSFGISRRDEQRLMMEDDKWMLENLGIASSIVFVMLDDGARSIV